MYSICYINGFQTQPGVTWPDDLLIHKGNRLLVDPTWPDEHIIDISTPAKRAAAASRQFASIDVCAAAGYAAVEFDNLDSYTRSADQLSLDDAVAFATLLVQRAHKAGLAAGQKNTSELGSRGRDRIGFDFAVVEECDQLRECVNYPDVYGARVIDIEYTDAMRCAALSPRCAPMPQHHDRRSFATASAPRQARQTIPTNTANGSLGWRLRATRTYTADLFAANSSYPQEDCSTNERSADLANGR